MKDKKFLEALERISNFCIAETGDACKNDLILIATKGGMTEEEIRTELPQLYESSDLDVEQPSDQVNTEEEEEEEEEQTENL